MMTIRFHTAAAAVALGAAALLAAPSVAATTSSTATAFRHHLTGTIVALSGSSLTLRLRTGERVAIDIATAEQKRQSGVLPLDRPVTVYGERGSDGRFHATSIGHAAPTARNWPLDAR